MSIYDVLMTALLLMLVILMVINHRTGWLASQIVCPPRSHERPSGYDARRMLLDAEERPGDLVHVPTSSSD